MSADGWLSPDTCGIKLGEFEELARLMGDAAAKLSVLASTVGFALIEAGVDVGPATDLRRVASWADAMAPDLRRRLQLAHDMDRQPTTRKTCRIDGTYLLAPDGYRDQVGQIDGGRAAGLLTEAAGGDPSALSALAALEPGSRNPYFARTLLSALRANRLLELAAGIAHQLRLDETEHERAGFLPTDSKHARAAFVLLANALAVGTTPGAGYAGDGFLNELQEAGRKHHHVPGAGDGDDIIGYQALSTILAFQPRARALPAHFFETVGRDMIDFDRGRQGAWPKWSFTPSHHSPMTDLSGHENLGAALVADREYQAASGADFLISLFDAARTAADAQSLLGHAHPASHVSTIAYLIHDRAPIWALSDGGAALGGLLVKAASGTDPISHRVFDDAMTESARHIRSYLTSNGDDKLSIDSTNGQDSCLEQLRPYLIMLLRSHLDTIDTSLFAEQSGLGGRTGGPSMRDIDAVIAEAARDSTNFNALVTDQIARTRASLDRQFASGEGLDNVIVSESTILGHLLALRREVAIAQGAANEKANKSTADLIDRGIGMIPIPYGKLFNGIPGDIFQYAVTRGYGKAGEWLKQQVAEQTTSESFATQTTNEAESICHLLRQMTMSAAMTHATESRMTVRSNEIFGKNGHIRPISEWSNNPVAVIQFIRWCDQHDFPAQHLSADIEARIANVHDEAVSSLIPQAHDGH